MTQPCAGPDPSPRKPKFEIPPGACDCHAHVFGPTERYPYFPGREYTPPDASLTAFEHMLRTLGMQRAVLVQPSVYAADNTAMLDAMAVATLEMRGVAVVEPGISGDELERLHLAGMRGIRFNIQLPGGLSMDDLEGLAARIKDFGWHIQIFSGIARIAEMSARLAALPVDVVIDHMGLMHPDMGMDKADFQGLLHLIDGGRCWVKLSGAYRNSKELMPYADVADVARTFIERAPERMVWATDWPHPVHEKPMPNDGDLCDLLLDWAPDPELRRKILVDNPAELYGFRDPANP